MNEDTHLSLLMRKEKSLYRWFICYILPGPCRPIERRVAIWFGLFRFFEHEQSSYFCRGPAPVGPTLVMVISVGNKKTKDQLSLHHGERAANT